MHFSKRLPRDTATLLQVTVFILVLLGLSFSSHDPASHHVKAISAVGAVCLLVVYMTWVVPYLRSDRPPGSDGSALHAAGGAEGDSQPAATAEAGASEEALPGPRLSLPATLTLLIVAGTASAFVSDWFVNALEPAILQLHISSPSPAS